MSYNPSPFEALENAVSAAGSQAALGKICDVSQTAVWKWVQSSKRVPAEYVLRIEAALGISRHLLRPDIYPRDSLVDEHLHSRFAAVDRRTVDRRVA